MYVYQMKVPCTCKTGEYVERKCDVETGTAVQCGSCDVFCGKGGACVGQAPDQCLSCGIPLAGEDSARTNSMPDLMSFLPSEASSSSSETLGTCHLCPLSCDQGSFMAEPCTADAQASCKQCSSCPVSNTLHIMDIICHPFPVEKSRTCCTCAFHLIMSDCICSAISFSASSYFCHLSDARSCIHVAVMPGHP